MEVIEEEDEVFFVADWLELPNHLTFQIMSKLTCSFDYARFGTVCMKWRSLYFNEEECPKLPTQLPLLIIPTPMKDGEEEEEKSCILMYMLTHGRLVYNRLRLTLSFDMHFRGSGHGWLIAVVDYKKSTDLSVELMNPFYSSDPTVIPLPSLATFPLDEKVVVGIDNWFYLRKAVLSADPISNPNDYMVMALYGESMRLALFKPGQTTWTPVHYEGELFDDVVYYKNKFYAVQYYGGVVVCNMVPRPSKVIGPPLKGIKYSAKEVVGPPLNGIPDSKKYIVESGGDLLQVHKKVVGPPTSTSTAPFMKVFKLSLDPTGNAGHYWVEVKDLCGRALFLGNDVSLSVSASHFPQCKANCIYYTNNEIETCYLNPNYNPRDMGVYNLGNNSFEKYYPTEIGTLQWPAPIWIEPPKLSRRRCFNMNEA